MGLFPIVNIYTYIFVINITYNYWLEKNEETYYT